MFQSLIILKAINIIIFKFKNKIFIKDLKNYSLLLILIYNIYSY